MVKLQKMQERFPAGSDLKIVAILEVVWISQKVDSVHLDAESSAGETTVCILAIMKLTPWLIDSFGWNAAALFIRLGLSLN